MHVSLYNECSNNYNILLSQWIFFTLLQKKNKLLPYLLQKCQILWSKYILMHSQVCTYFHLKQNFAYSFYENILNSARKNIYPTRTWTRSAGFNSKRYRVNLKHTQKKVSSRCFLSGYIVLVSVKIDTRRRNLTVSKRSFLHITNDTCV